MSRTRSANDSGGRSTPTMSRTASRSSSRIRSTGSSSQSEPVATTPVSSRRQTPTYTRPTTSTATPPSSRHRPSASDKPGMGATTPSRSRPTGPSTVSRGGVTTPSRSRPTTGPSNPSSTPIRTPSRSRPSTAGSTSTSTGTRSGIPGTPSSHTGPGSGIVRSSGGTIATPTQRMRQDAALHSTRTRTTVSPSPQRSPGVSERLQRVPVRYAALSAAQYRAQVLMAAKVTAASTLQSSDASTPRAGKGSSTLTSPSHRTKADMARTTGMYGASGQDLDTSTNQSFSRYPRDANGSFTPDVYSPRKQQQQQQQQQRIQNATVMMTPQPQEKSGKPRSKQSTPTQQVPQTSLAEHATVYNGKEGEEQDGDNDNDDNTQGIPKLDIASASASAHDDDEDESHDASQEQPLTQKQDQEQAQQDPEHTQTQTETQTSELVDESTLPSITTTEIDAGDQQDQEYVNDVDNEDEAYVSDSEQLDAEDPEGLTLEELDALTSQQRSSQENCESLATRLQTAGLVGAPPFSPTKVKANIIAQPPPMSATFVKTIVTETGRKKSMVVTKPTMNTKETLPHPHVALAHLRHTTTLSHKMALEEAAERERNLREIKYKLRMEKANQNRQLRTSKVREARSLFNTQYTVPTKEERVACEKMYQQKLADQYELRHAYVSDALHQRKRSQSRHLRERQQTYAERVEAARILKEETDKQHRLKAKKNIEALNARVTELQKQRELAYKRIHEQVELGKILADEVDKAKYEWEQDQLEELRALWYEQWLHKMQNVQDTKLKHIKDIETDLFARREKARKIHLARLQSNANGGSTGAMDADTHHSNPYLEEALFYTAMHDMEGAEFAEYAEIIGKNALKKGNNNNSNTNTNNNEHDTQYDEAFLSSSSAYNNDSSGDGGEYDYDAFINSIFASTEPHTQFEDGSTSTAQPAEHKDQPQPQPQQVDEIVIYEPISEPRDDTNMTSSSEDAPVSTASTVTDVQDDTSSTAGVTENSDMKDTTNQSVEDTDTAVPVMDIPVEEVTPVVEETTEQTQEQEQPQQVDVMEDEVEVVSDVTVEVSSSQPQTAPASAPLVDTNITPVTPVTEEVSVIVEEPVSAPEPAPVEAPVVVVEPTTSTTTTTTTTSAEPSSFDDFIANLQLDDTDETF